MLSKKSVSMCLYLSKNYYISNFVLLSLVKTNVDIKCISSYINNFLFLILGNFFVTRLYTCGWIIL